MEENIIKIDSKVITEVVSALCKRANIHVAEDVYNKLSEAYLKESYVESKNTLWQILENVRLASEIQRPICQDTGFVVVFLEVGQKVFLTGKPVEDAVNLGVKKAYSENKFRYSIVKDPIFDRENTNTNEPAVIHTRIVEGESVKISVVIKGCGSENVGVIKMLKPFAGPEEIVKFAVETVKNSVRNSCPPVRLGIGIGGTMDYATYLSKKALLEPIKSEEEMEESSDKITKLELDILRETNKLKIGASCIGGDTTVFAVNVLTYPTHIAALPVAVNFSCHASRHACAEIFEKEVVYKNQKDYDFLQISNVEESLKRINVNQVDELRKLRAGDRLLISGSIYTARDAAHKKMIDALEKGEDLPIDIKNKTIYYVGPCPPVENEVIGPAGPTTAIRMDRYTPELMNKGLIATIGKGRRGLEVKEALKKNKGVYFILTGGTACLIAKKIKSAKVVAYPELGSEAIYQLELENLPVTVGIDSTGKSLF